VGGTNQFAAYQNEMPMDAFLPGFCAALYPCDACTAVDFLKLPNALFHEGSMRVNHAHAENRVIIETLQSPYVDLDRLRHEARVVEQVAKKDNWTSIYLETEFFSPEDQHMGVAKCEFWVEQTQRGPKIAMIEIISSMLQPDMIRDKLFAGAARVMMRPLISRGILLIRALVKASEQMRA
jgi:hypothetical protein